MPETAPDRDEREEQIREIEAMMAAGEFVRGSTARDLAQRWNKPLQTVRDRTAEASKRLRAELNPDMVALYAARHLTNIVEETDRDGDRIAALKLMVEISGAAAPKKVELSTVPTDELKRELREMAAAVLADDE